MPNIDTNNSPSAGLLNSKGSGLLNYQYFLAHEAGLEETVFNLWAKKLQNSQSLRVDFFKHVINEYCDDTISKFVCYSTLSDKWAEVKRNREFVRKLNELWCVDSELDIEDTAWVRRIELPQESESGNQRWTTHDFLGELLVFGFLYLLLKSTEKGVSEGELRLVRGEANPETTKKLSDWLLPNFINIVPNQKFVMVHSADERESFKELDTLINVCGSIDLKYEIKTTRNREDNKNHFLMHSCLDDLIIVEDWDMLNNEPSALGHTIISNSPNVHSFFAKRWEEISNRAHTVFDNGA